MMMMLIMINVA